METPHVHWTFKGHSIGPVFVLSLLTVVAGNSKIIYTLLQQRNMEHTISECESETELTSSFQLRTKTCNNGQGIRTRPDQSFLILSHFMHHKRATPLKMGGYKRTFFAALWQARFYLLRQASAAEA